MSKRDGGSYTPRLTAVWRTKSFSNDVPDVSPPIKNEGSFLKLLRTKSMPLLGREGTTPPRGFAFSPRQTHSPVMSESPSPVRIQANRMILRDMNNGQLSDASESTVPSMATPPPTPRSPSPTRPRVRSASDGHLWQHRKKQVRNSTEKAIMLPSVKRLRGKFDEKSPSPEKEKSSKTDHKDEATLEEVSEMGKGRERRVVSRHYSLVRGEIKIPERKWSSRPAVTPDDLRKGLEKYETSPENKDKENIFSGSDSRDLASEHYLETTSKSKTLEYPQSQSYYKRLSIRSKNKNHRRTKSEPDPSALQLHHAMTSPPSVKKLKLLFEREAMTPSSTVVSGRHRETTLVSSQVTQVPVKSPEESGNVDSNTDNEMHLAIADPIDLKQHDKTPPLLGMNQMLTGTTSSVKSLRQRFEEGASVQSLLKTGEEEAAPKSCRIAIHQFKRPLEEAQRRLSRSMSPDREAHHFFTAFANSSVKNLLRQFEALSSEEIQWEEQVNLTQEHKSERKLSPPESPKKQKIVHLDHARREIPHVAWTVEAKVDSHRRQSQTSSSESSSDESMEGGGGRRKVMNREKKEMDMKRIEVKREKEQRKTNDIEKEKGKKPNLDEEREIREKTKEEKIAIDEEKMKERETSEHKKEKDKLLELEISNREVKGKERNGNEKQENNRETLKHEREIKEKTEKWREQEQMMEERTGEENKKNQGSRTEESNNKHFQKDTRDYKSSEADLTRQTKEKTLEVLSSSEPHEDVDKISDRAMEKSSDRVMEESSEGAIERSSERAMEKNSDRTIDSSSKRAMEESDKAKENGSDRGIDNSSARAMDKGSISKVHDMVDRFTNLSQHDDPLQQESNTSHVRVEGLIDQFTKFQDFDFEGEAQKSETQEKEEVIRRCSDVSALVNKFSKMNARRRSSSSLDSDSDESSEKSTKEETPIPTIPTRSTCPGKVRTLREDEMQFFDSAIGGTESFLRTQSLRVKKNEPSSFLQPRFGSLRGSMSRVAVLSTSKTATAALPRNCRQLNSDELRFFSGEVTNIYSSRGTKPRGRAGKTTSRDIRLAKVTQDEALPDTEEFFRIAGHGERTRESNGRPNLNEDESDSDFEPGVLRSSDDVTDHEDDFLEMEINIRSDTDTENHSDTERHSELDLTLSRFAQSIQGELMQSVATDGAAEAESKCYVIFTPNKCILSSEDEDETLQFSFSSPRFKERVLISTPKDNEKCQSIQMHENILHENPYDTENPDNIAMLMTPMEKRKGEEQDRGYMGSGSFSSLPKSYFNSSEGNLKPGQMTHPSEHNAITDIENGTGIDFLGETKVDFRGLEVTGSELTEGGTAEMSETDGGERRCLEMDEERDSDREVVLKEGKVEMKVSQAESGGERRPTDDPLQDLDQCAISAFLDELERLNSKSTPLQPITPPRQEDMSKQLNDDDTSSDSGSSDDEDQRQRYTELNDETLRSIEEQIIPSTSFHFYSQPVESFDPSRKWNVPATAKGLMDSEAPSQGSILPLGTIENLITPTPPSGSQESEPLKERVTIKQEKQTFKNSASQYPRREGNGNSGVARDTTVKVDPSTEEKKNIIGRKEFVKLCIFSLLFSIVAYFLSDFLD